MDTLKPVSIDLHGQDKERNHLVYHAERMPRKREKVRTGLYSLGSAQTTAIPSGPVGIHSPKLEKLHLIHPYQWGNIWVYGESMTMLGYITRAVFHQKAEKVPVDTDLPNPCMGDVDLLSLLIEALTLLRICSTGRGCGRNRFLKQILVVYPNTT
jgi:hypothetical protein